MDFRFPLKRANSDGNQSVIGLWIGFVGESSVSGKPDDVFEGLLIVPSGHDYGAFPIETEVCCRQVESIMNALAVRAPAADVSCSSLKKLARLLAQSLISNATAVGGEEQDERRVR